MIEHSAPAIFVCSASDASARTLLYAVGMRDHRRRPNTNLTGELEIKEVPIGLIKESDALRLRIPPYFGVEELAADIRVRGQTTPLFVRPTEEGHYELISGYCRLAALEQLKAATAIVRVFRDLDDQDAYDLAINENQGRNALSEIERANICLRLQTEGRTSKQIAERMQWNAESSVFRYLRLAREAPPPLREALQERKISLRIAATFLDHGLTLPEEVQRSALAAAAEHDMSSAEFKRYLRRAAGTETTTPTKKEPFRKLKNGGFVLCSTRVASDDPAAVDQAIETLETALKEARRLKRKLSSNEALAVQEETR